MMKKILTALLLMLSMTALGQNKKYDKLLDKYDVLPYLNNIQEKSTSNFWYAVWSNNPELKKMMEASEKKKDTFLKAKEDMYHANLGAELYRQILTYITNVPALDTLAMNLLDELGVMSQRSDFNIKYVYNPEVNASADPNANILIYIGLLDADMNFMMLLGVMAHEVTHTLLMHTMQNMYETQVKYKKNQIAGAITAGANALAAGYAQANGVQVGWDDVNKTTYDLANAAYDDAFNHFHYKYSREEELEADIVAFRFPDWIGLGGEFYLNALEVLKDNDVVSNKDKDGDHPTVAYRIELLKYMANTRGRIIGGE